MLGLQQMMSHTSNSLNYKITPQLLNLKKKKNLIHEVIHELLKVVYVMQLMFSFITCFI